MEKMDRRKRKTQKAIKEAYIKLASEKDFSKITVKEITALADISRKTFYLNYVDINDLISKMEDEILNDFIEFSKNYNYNEVKTNPYPFLNELTNTLTRDELFIKLILANSKLGLLEKIRALLKNGISAVYNSSDSSISELKISFIVSGLLDSYIEWYLYKKDTVSLSSFCENTSKLVSACIQSL